MSKKRQATTELNHDNWDQEEEQEDPGQFTSASNDRLSGRKILAARRRKPGEPGEKPAGIFSGFSGFGQAKKPAPTSESSNFSATTAGPLFGSQEVAPSLSSIAPPLAGSLLKFGKETGMQVILWLFTHFYHIGQQGLRLISN